MYGRGYFFGIAFVGRCVNFLEDRSRCRQVAVCLHGAEKLFFAWRRFVLQRRFEHGREQLDRCLAGAAGEFEETINATAAGKLLQSDSRWRGRPIGPVRDDLKEATVVVDHCPLRIGGVVGHEFAHIGHDRRGQIGHRPARIVARIAGHGDDRSGTLLISRRRNERREHAGTRQDHAFSVDEKLEGSWFHG